MNYSFFNFNAVSKQRGHEKCLQNLDPKIPKLTWRPISIQDDSIEIDLHKLGFSRSQ